MNRAPGPVIATETDLRGIAPPTWDAGLDAFDTPLLLVDLDRAEANADRIATACRRAGVRWRPHVKGLKAPALAHLLQARGAEGVTCATVAEAALMAASGLDDILIANQVAGAGKIARLVALRSAGRRVTVAVDDPGNAAALGQAAAAAGVVLPVVLEIEVGMRRAGVLPGHAADLARRVAATDGLALAGVMAWEGHTARLPDPAAKREAITTAIAQLVAAAESVRAAGLPVGIVSCGGTGTYAQAAHEPGITEIQAGGGVLGDLAYRMLYGVDHAPALFVLATVTSRPTPTRVVCDAGRKSLGTETALPVPLGLGPLAEVRFSAEHATIELRHPSPTPAVGDRLSFVPGYADTTVHLHDRMLATRAGRLEAVWPLRAPTASEPLA